MPDGGRIDLERDLNPEQRAAVEAPDGPVLVIAAAGTGKTRTLTYRVAHLVERGVDPRRMLLLTFTNRAAREMLERARRLVGESVGGIWGGTFHHLANRMLRRHAKRAGFGSDYTILDEDDARGLVRTCATELGLRDRHFPKPEVLLGLFGLASSREQPLLDTVLAHFHGPRIDPGDIQRVHDAYAARKQALNAMDFDDLLAHALRLLREHPDVLAGYQERFLHVLVDEYQDTNPIQAGLVDALAGGHRNLLVVGDDFQSIYSWRGADFQNILHFPDRYPDTRVFKLETNYRSVPGILEVANACIAGNPRQFQKTLRAVREGARRPVVAELRDGRQQARYVVERVYTLLREGYRAPEIAVLYRSHFHAMELQLELAREGIPYAITSGVRFFEQAHIKDVCAILRLLHNPGDELAFKRLLCLLPRVGERTAERLWRELGQRFNPGLAGHRRFLGARLPAAARKDWKEMAAVLFETGPDAGMGTPGEILHRFRIAYYEKYAEEAFEDFERRLEDVNELVNYAGRFGSVGDLLGEVALMTNLDVTGQGGRDDEDALLLSTVHQAKGLEWKAVIVIWLADRLFPSQRSVDEAGDDEEERRLFYVAVTRARDVLYLCCPRMRTGRDGRPLHYAPSRFVKEIPAQLLEYDRISHFA